MSLNPGNFRQKSESALADASAPLLLPRQPSGFSLIEVMITGIAVLVMISGFSQILEQGLTQQQLRLEQSWLTAQMDLWTADFAAYGFNHQDLADGSHQKVIESPVGGKYQLNWQVEHPVLLLKVVSLQLHSSSHSAAKQYQWKIAIPAWKNR